MGTPQYFMDLIKRGPSAGGLEKDVWFFIPTKDNVMCQPSLCAHAVLTFTRGLSLVTGWEARDQSNQVVDRTLGSFAYGVRKGVVKRIVISNNKKAVLDWAKEREVSTGGGSDVTEHVQSFFNSGIILKIYNKRGNRRKWGGKRETKTQSNDNENIVYSFLPPKDPSME